MACMLTLSILIPTLCHYLAGMKKNIAYWNSSQKLAFIKVPTCPVKSQWFLHCLTMHTVVVARVAIAFARTTNPTDRGFSNSVCHALKEHYAMMEVKYSATEMPCLPVYQAVIYVYLIKYHQNISHPYCCVVSAMLLLLHHKLHAVSYPFSL